jgi:hypothetical protein
METRFLEQDGLALINEMIQRARNNFRKGSMDHMIFWGYLTAAVATVNYVLLQTLANPTAAYWVWALMAPGAIADFFIRQRNDRIATVKTHIDRIIYSIWQGFMIGVALFLALIFGMAILLEDRHLFFLITPVILLMLGISEFVTARSCRSKLLFWVSVILWTGAVLCIIPLDMELSGQQPSATLHQGHQLIILAVCMIAGFVVPGHWINHKARQCHV